jgi:HAD superfamily hydrolase (TIGR01549 family)
MNLIFDFDGTICDSFNAVFAVAVNHFPELNDPPITSDEARNLGIKELIKRSNIPKYKIPQIMINSRKELSKYMHKLQTFPNIDDVIRRLSKKHKLGILTTNSKKNVITFLEKNKLNKYFDFVHSELALFGKHKKLIKVMKRHSLNPNETIYIGDETRDVEAAKEVGIKSVAVNWGYEAEKLLQKANPDMIISSPVDLLKL